METTTRIVPSSIRFNFTPVAFRRLLTQIEKSPPEKQIDYWDISTPGLSLRASTSGACTWYLTTRVLRDGAKKLARFPLGHYDKDTLALSDARTTAKELKERIKKGEDPKVTKEKAEAVALIQGQDTFLVVADLFLELHGKKNLKPTTLAQYTSLLKGKSKDFAPLYSKPVSAITREDIIGVLRRIRKRGKGVTVNRALTVAKKMMKWAKNEGYIKVHPFPKDDIDPWVKEVERERHLFGTEEVPSEIGIVWRACEEIGKHRALPRLLLLTGARLNEVAGMRWEEIKDNSIWRIPAERTKTGKERSLPLGPLALKLIHTMPEVTPFVFPTTRKTKKNPTGQPRPISGFSDLKEKLDEAITTLNAGQSITPWRLHDLRRTAKTGWAELGIPADIRDALAGHKKPGMDAIYNQAEYLKPKREALLKWETKIQELRTY